MYDTEDVHTLTQRFLEIMELRKTTSKENNFNTSMGQSRMDKSQSRKITRDEEIRQRKHGKTVGKLLYQEFLKVILDF